MIEAVAKPLAAPLLGAPSTVAHRLATETSQALAAAAAAEATSGHSDRAPTPRAPDEAPTASSSSSSALRASSQLSRWSRARALRSGRRLEAGLDRAAVSSSPPVTMPPQQEQPPSLLHDDYPAVAVEEDDGDDDVCVVEKDAAAGKAIYMVSDGTGWTAEHAVEAALGQFENCLVDRGCAVNTHLFSGVSILPRVFTGTY
ncbi:unnamed protein product [Urochloa humidicola]